MESIIKMTNYKFDNMQVIALQPNELKEKRKKVLDEVRKKRAELYKRLRAEGKII